VLELGVDGGQMNIHSDNKILASDN